MYILLFVIDSLSWFEKSKELLLKLIEDRNIAFSCYEKDEKPQEDIVTELKESRSRTTQTWKGNRKDSMAG